MNTAVAEEKIRTLTPEKNDVLWLRKIENAIIHVDDFTDAILLGEFSGDKGICLAQFMLTQFRLEAVRKIIFSEVLKAYDMKLFVTYEGARWRVTGASRLGDVWLSHDLKRENGYDVRVELNFTTLTEWSGQP